MLGQIDVGPEFFADGDGQADVFVRIIDARLRVPFSREDVVGKTVSARVAERGGNVKTSIMSATSIPIRSASRAPSQVAIKMVCRTMLFKSFIAWPEPTGPR